MLHLRFEGRSFELDPRQLDLGSHSSDQKIKQAVAGWIGVDLMRFRDYVVDRRPGGHVVVRPEAIYG